LYREKHIYSKMILQHPLRRRSTRIIQRDLRRRLRRGLRSDRKVLDGLFVLDLSAVLAGPSCSQFLAELGADVIKIESARGGSGDVTRSWRLPVEARDGLDSSYFQCCNSGKRSVAVDISKAEGLALVQRLGAKAEVILASYKPGDAKKLQVDYESFKKINPSVIYGQISGYGGEDPRSGFDAVIQAESGLQYMNGDPSGKPVKMPLAMVDLLTAHQLKEGVMTSLLHRERTGEGSFVEADLMGSAVSSLANQATGYLLRGIVPERMGSDHPSIVPYGTIFECGDSKMIVFGVGADHQFQRLCEVLQIEDMSSDERFRTNRARVLNRETCISKLRDALSRVTDREVLLEKLKNLSVPAAGVNKMDEVFELNRASELVLRHEGSGEPYGLSQIAFKTSLHDNNNKNSNKLLPPPKYGEHTTSVLSEVLNLSQKEIDILREGNIIY
ncbi:CoA transferase, partial [bacterium]|nr:CoA transferase [bacterium]